MASITLQIPIDGDAPMVDGLMHQGAAAARATLGC